MIKTEFELTVDEREHAEELIEELQERVANLGTRKDGNLKMTCRPAAYEPTIHTIKIGDDEVVIRVRMSELRVSHKGRLVLSISGARIDTINIDALDFALQHIRRYMILDDLANV